MRKGHYLWLVMVILTGFLHPLAAQSAIISTWSLNGDGNWNNAANWDGGFVPNGANYQVIIDSNPLVNVTVSLNQNITLSGLNLDANDKISINDNGGG